MKKELKFSFSWKVSQIWWLIFIPLCFVHWLAPLIAGLLAKKRSWILWATYYLLTVILLFAVAPMPDTMAIKDLLIGIFFFSWMGCIIHSIVIAKNYLKMMMAKAQGRPIERQKRLDKQEIKILKNLPLRHKNLMRTMLSEQKEIMENYNKIDPLLQNSMLDILEMVETYIDYAHELMAKEVEIAGVIRKIDINNIESRIRQLKQQISKTTNINLKNEYLEAIDNHEKQKNTYHEFIEKRKIINLKLESNIVKLREIKYDLIELSYKVSENEKDNIFKKVNELSDDMEVLVENVRDTKNELNL